MGEFLSPYKEVGIKAAANPGKRKPAPKPRGDAQKQVERTGHQFSEDAYRGSGSELRRFKHQSDTRLCRYCKRPRFAVEFFRCPGKR